MASLKYDTTVFRIAYTQNQFRRNHKNCGMAMSLISIIFKYLYTWYTCMFISNINGSLLKKSLKESLMVTNKKAYGTDLTRSVKKNNSRQNRNFLKNLNIKNGFQ